MTDMTNVHSGSIPINGIINTGPLSVDDERELMQLFFDMIQSEKYLEETK